MHGDHEFRLRDINAGKHAPPPRECHIGPSLLSYGSDTTVGPRNYNSGDACGRRGL